MTSRADHGSQHTPSWVVGCWYAFECFTAVREPESLHLTPSSLILTKLHKLPSASFRVSNACDSTLCQYTDECLSDEKSDDHGVAAPQDNSIGPGHCSSLHANALRQTLRTAVTAFELNLRTQSSRAGIPSHLQRPEKMYCHSNLLITGR